MLCSLRISYQQIFIKWQARWMNWLRQKQKYFCISICRMSSNWNKQILVYLFFHQEKIFTFFCFVIRKKVKANNLTKKKKEKKEKKEHTQIWRQVKKVIILSIYSYNLQEHLIFFILFYCLHLLLILLFIWQSCIIEKGTSLTKNKTKPAKIEWNIT